MRLVDDWHLILTRAWSVRFALIAGLCEGLNITLQMVGTTVAVQHPFVLSIAAGVFACAAPIARLIPQRNLQ